MKNSEPEDKQKLCRLDAKYNKYILHNIVPRLIIEARPALSYTTWHPHWRDTNEETGQVQCWWGKGQWAYIANGPNQLLSKGQRPRVR